MRPDYDLTAKRVRSCWPVIPMLGLAALVLAAYAIILRFPFIQDDWGWISRFQSNHPDEILKSIFAIKGTIFFRPLAGLYLYVMYLVFGAHPLLLILLQLIQQPAGSAAGIFPACDLFESFDRGTQAS
jgi:hypothetical protein